MAIEIELKLRVDPDDTHALCHALNRIASAQPARQLRNVYYDTENAALAAQRSALRIRQHGDQYEQTLKTVGRSDAGLQQRHEWNWPLTSPQLSVEPLQHADVQAHWPRDIVIEQLKPHFSTHFERHVWLWQDSESTVEIVLDQGTIEHVTTQQPLCELELELLSGDIESLWQLAQQLAAQCPLWLSDISKAERGYQLAAHCSPWQPRLATQDIACATANPCLQALQRSLEYTLWYEQDLNHDHVNTLLDRLHDLLNESAQAALHSLAHALNRQNASSLHTLRQHKNIGQDLLTICHIAYTQTHHDRTESTSPSYDV